MISVPEDIRERVNKALDGLKTLTAAYVDESGKPHISLYGSTHFHSPDQLAIWVRNPDGALPRTIGTRPEMAFIYADIADRVYVTMEGRARLVQDAEVRERVYNDMHPIERQFDAEQGGVAVLIDLDRVSLLTKAGKEVLERA